jgi:hypothetical protein
MTSLVPFQLPVHLPAHGSKPRRSHYQFFRQIWRSNAPVQRSASLSLTMLKSRQYCRISRMYPCALKNARRQRYALHIAHVRQWSIKPVVSTPPGQQSCTRRRSKSSRTCRRPPGRRPSPAGRTRNNPLRGSNQNKHENGNGGRQLKINTRRINPIARK